MFSFFQEGLKFKFLEVSLPVCPHLSVPPVFITPIFVVNFNLLSDSSKVNLNLFLKTVYFKCS